MEAAETFKLLKFPIPPPLLLEEASSLFSVVLLSILSCCPPVLLALCFFYSLWILDLSHWLLVPPLNTPSQGEPPGFRSLLLWLQLELQATSSSLRCCLLQPLAVPHLLSTSLSTHLNLCEACKSHCQLLQVQWSGLVGPALRNPKTS